MPNATVYIRKRDWEQWLALENKSEFIHNALKGAPLIPGVSEGMLGTVILPTADPLHKLSKIIKEKNVKFCKNSHPIPDGQYKCLGKGCKYA